LAAYLCSFIIPYFAFDVFPIYVETVSEREAVFRNPQVALQQAVNQGLELGQLLTYFYFAVATFFFLRMLKSVWTIANQIRLSPKHYNKDYTIVENTINDQTFTFFRYLFQPQSKKIDNEVAAHEMIHIKQWHSLDIIISELVKVVLWFNPIAYLLQKQIKLNHEFICDAFAASLSSPFKYAQYLSKSISNNNNLILASNFAYKLKNRIIMLEKSVSNLNQKWRYLSLVPLILCLMFFFSCEKYVVEKEPIKEKLTMTVTDTVTTFNYETYEEQIQIVRREVDAVEIVDTVVLFDPNSYEERIEIVKTLVPKVTNDEEYQNKQSTKTTIVKSDNSQKKYSRDTISTLDYDTGKWTEKVVVNTDKCYGFYWGTRFNSSDEITVDDAIANLTSKIQIKKITRDEKCGSVNSYAGRIIFLYENLDPVVFAFNSRRDKIGTNKEIEKRIKKGAKIYIENLKVNGGIELKGKVISII